MANGRKNKKYTPPPETALLRKALAEALQATDNQGRVAAGARHGIYLFYDYDGEPIYVGQTYEQLNVRIRRHLTNQRTDAVAMNVLDPFEVAEIEMWSFFDLDALVADAATEEAKREARRTAKQILNRAEFTVHINAIEKSQHKAILNEGDILPTTLLDLPPSVRVHIIPDKFFEVRKHPDTRIARRAATIAALARVISEREVSKGLRRTLLTQAQRLEHLAQQRLGESTELIPLQGSDEEV